MAKVEGADGLTLFDVGRSFGAFEALRGVSLRVAPGEVVALFGANGAGKTTLLRIAAGLLRPSAGRVIIDGHDLGAEPSAAKRRVGWAADRPLLYDGLSAFENLEFFARLYGMRGEKAAAAASEALNAAGLSRRAHDAVGTLSQGMRQRLSLARAMVHRPTVLLLDEPFEGLDPASQQRFGASLRDATARKERAVLFVTQQVEAGLSLCDRVAVLDEGRLAKFVARADLEPAELLRALGAGGGGGRGQ